MFFAKIPRHTRQNAITEGDLECILTHNCEGTEQLSLYLQLVRNIRIMEKFTGKVWVLGDDIDTDIIIPTEYLALKTIDDMKQYGFSPLRPELAGQIQKGDIIVAGKNFGCGSSREQAPEIIKALGIQCVIAKSFARIFFRNSINNGLLLIEQPDLHDDMKEGDTVTVVMNEHVDYNGKQYPIASLPENLMSIIQAGGLVKAMRKLNGLD